MATISTPSSGPAILVLPSVQKWRFMGLEITTSYVSTTNTVYNLILSGTLADASTSITVQAQLPQTLIYDRLYVHGLSTANVTRGIDMDSQGTAIVDSYCDEIHTNNSDSQCFFGFNGPGPYLIQNNFVQGAGENIMFGGSDPAITNLVPSDITIVGNLIQKNQTWRGEASPYNWDVKNLFELKNAQRVLLDGNVIQYTWDSGQDEAMIWRSVNQGGTCTWCVVQDVTGTHNIIQHVPMAFVLAGSDTSSVVSAGTHRILIKNNVMTDVNSVTWGGSGWLIQLSSASSGATLDNITIDHNTGFETNMILSLGNSGVVNNVQYTNNLTGLGTYGIFGNGGTKGKSAITTWLTNYVYNDDAIIGSDPGGYPTGTFFNTQSRMEFTSVTGTDLNLSGNFQLTSNSPYYRAGTDGKDIGVWDWTCLNYDTAAALAGNFVPNPGCVLSGNLQPQPPTSLTATVD
jgi:hypothetical protein